MGCRAFLAAINTYFQKLPKPPQYYQPQPDYRSTFPRSFPPSISQTISGDELDSGAIKDKAAKMAYLDKLAALVGICMGHKINVRPSKVVAGLEPEGTNALLMVRVQTNVQGFF